MNHETQLQNEIRLALGTEEDLVLWRNNVMKAKTYDEKTGKPRYLVGGLPEGSPDLVGILRGRFVGLEVKMPGNYPEPHQREFLELIRRFGGFATVVRSVDEAKAAIERARKGQSQ